MTKKNFVYEAPELEVLELKVETGFAASTTFGTDGDMGYGDSF